MHDFVLWLIFWISLSRNDITDTHGVVLANVLQSQSHLVRLDLGRNDIGINTITQICENISKYWSLRRIELMY